MHFSTFVLDFNVPIICQAVSNKLVQFDFACLIKLFRPPSSKILGEVHFAFVGAAIVTEVCPGLHNTVLDGC